ncbi:T9SS type A sorting domain-containing protein [Flavobacterium sp.]|uniref:T9SS type A sorting domain-containing protein n=1 Tax=Flavobacterium sp. TaxID=239 RepID=UPI00260E4F00|nr:T9SS type A sorting domain-containing protein [Flavobacterium sp.]
MKKLIFRRSKIVILLTFLLNLIGIQCFSQVNCLNNGVNITITGSTTSPYSPSASTTVCLPDSAFTGVGFYTGNTATGVVTYTFSQPITSATVTYSAVNLTADTDVGQITINGGGTLTLTNPCGVAITGGNTLTCNLANAFGDVSVTVNSTLPFTTITLTNIGDHTGWVQGNPCNFILCLPTETLISPLDDMNNNFANGFKLIERSNWISASNIINIGNNNLLDGVVYHAANFVDLTPGFDAVFGSQFAAYPEGCTGNTSFVYKHQNNGIRSESYHPSVFESNMSFQLYPNPSTDLVELLMQNNMSIKVLIFSLDGKIIFEKSLQDKSSYQLDVSQFEKGIYIVNVISDDGQIHTEKLIKN